MKIYALVYKYKRKKEDGSEYSMTQLSHTMDEDLEGAMEKAEKQIYSSEGYIEYSCKLSLKNIISLDDVLNKIKVSLPELVKSAKQRERLMKVSEAMKESE